MCRCRKGEGMSDIKEIKNNAEAVAGILDMAMGAFKERADYVMSEILANIQDPNCPAVKARSMKIQIDFLPDDTRKQIVVETKVDKKLVPTASVKTMLCAVKDKSGETVYKEMTIQAPGQMDLFGGVQEEPKTLKVVKGGA